jgi:hypothetical protein
VLGRTTMARPAATASDAAGANHEPRRRDD